MKKISILLFLTLTCCYNQERSCKDFKTGTFKFKQVVNGKTIVSVFERQNNIQIETFNNTTDTATVRWVNDCEYILQKMHPKNRAEKKAIAIKILSTTKNGYNFEYNFVGDDKKQKGSVTKIK